jgi:hypothetical protein
LQAGRDEEWTTVDERQLSELFRDAAEGGPPASFGHAEVVARSRRITARRRMAVAGSALGLVLVAGGVAVGGGYLRGVDSGVDSGTGQAASAGAAQQQREAAPPNTYAPPQDQAGQLAVPATPAPGKGDLAAGAEQGRASSGKVFPWPGQQSDGNQIGSCGPVDADLAAALTGELPAGVGATPAAVPDGCPEGARAAAVPVPGGALYVVLAPAADNAPSDGPLSRQDGAVGQAVRTRAGLVLAVLSVPTADGGPAPYADQVSALATKLAQRF